MANAFNKEARFGDFSRDLFIPLIDGNTIRRFVGQKEDGEGYAWARVDKSEIFDFAMNPQTETKAYIDTKNDETSITSFQLSQDQEIVIDGNNEVYSLLYEYAINFPTGSDAEVPCALIMPSVLDPDKADMLVWDKAMLVPSDINSVDKKLTFTMQLNGDHKRGTGAKGDGGRFEFTEGAASVPEAASLSAKSGTKVSFAADKDDK